MPQVGFEARPVGSSPGSSWCFPAAPHKEADPSWHKSLSSYYSPPNGRGRKPLPILGCPYTPSIFTSFPLLSLHLNGQGAGGSGGQQRGEPGAQLASPLLSPPIGPSLSQPGHQHPSTLQLYLHLLGPLGSSFCASYSSYCFFSISSFSAT